MIINNVYLSRAEELTLWQIHLALSEIPHSPSKDILIIIDDFTRPNVCVYRMVIEHFLNIKGEGSVTVLVASGSHRASSRQEMEAKIGSDLLKRLRLFYHSPLCSFPLHQYKSHYVVAVGCVIPHNFVGLSGLEKILIPGLAAAQDVIDFHNCPPFEVRHKFAQEGGKVDCFVNYTIRSIVPNEYQVTSIYCGPGDDRESFEYRHRARELYRVKLPPECDVAILIPFVKNKDFMQAMNAMQVFNQYNNVRSGGLICVDATVTDGIGVHYGFQQPNGLSPVCYDDLFYGQFLNREFCILSATLPSCAIQDYFRRQVFHCETEYSLVRFIEERYGRTANVCAFNGADIMIGVL